MINGCVLQIIQNCTDVSSVFRTLQRWLLNVCKVRTQIPLRENALRLGESMGVQDSSDLLGEANNIVRISRTIRIRVPGVKIQGQLMRGTVIEEAFEVRTAVEGKGFGIAADLECGINGLEGPGDFF